MPPEAAFLSVHSDGKDFYRASAEVWMYDDLKLVPPPRPNKGPGVISCFRIPELDVHLVKLSSFDTFTPVVCSKPEFEGFCTGFDLVEVLCFDWKV